MPSVSHKCLFLRPRNSASGLAPLAGGWCGAYSATSVAVSSDSTATTAKPQRQPTACPSQVAAGTPTMVAAVSPISTRADAWARRSCDTKDAATSMAMPK